ncbi:MAG TPA: hypothetical protein PKA88_13970 [Polyangiaceae bacterium]|nr:hypothetical protein [Polyangiaceae bacterium]HMR77640.1 hypothetical protein [Polyangiaceae bacterium]
MTQLRVSYPKPGFFLSDIRVVIRMDGTPIYDGSFLSGFDVVVEASPGSHTVQSELMLPPFSRKREFLVNIAEGELLHAELVYSRLWGNFKKTLKLTSGATG